MRAWGTTHMAYAAGIVGAAGYAGVELVRLLLSHPDFELKVITSNADAGQLLASVYPAFAGMSDLVFSAHDDPTLTACDVVFLAVPHTAALAVVPELLAADVTVVDLSADYRLNDPAVYEHWYGATHTSPELLQVRAFGLPELFAEDLARLADRHAAGDAVLVACAGCFPTATSLAAAPAIRAGWTAPTGPVVVDAISGVTGAGKTPSARTHYCGADENVEAYNVCRHRHTPEIEQILELSGRIVFTPHLAPLRRGLLSTVTLPLADDLRGLGAEEAVAYYRDFYADFPFVRVLDAGQTPKTSSVVGSNASQIGLAVNPEAGVLIAIAAIDNLCKGAAGQAVQCANIVFGLDERRGLPLLALPV